MTLNYEVSVKPEIWKVIEDFPDYKVSNEGRVKSHKREKFWTSKGSLTGAGYFFVMLCNREGNFTRTVHTLVLETFLSPRPEGYIANHRDGNKQNNYIENLEWVTPSENIKHAYKLGLTKSLGWSQGIGENNSHSKLKDGEVWLIKRLLWFEYPQRKIAKMFSIGKSTVTHINLGESWTHIEFEPTEKDRKIYRRSFL